MKLMKGWKRWGFGHGKAMRKEKDEPERILSRGGIGAMISGALKRLQGMADGAES